METKTKIILGIWGAFYCFFILFGSWHDRYQVIDHSFVLQPPWTATTIMMDSLIMNLAVITILALIAYLAARKFIN